MGKSEKKGKNSFGRFIIYTVILAVVIVGCLAFNAYARKTYNENPQAESMIVALLKKKPTIKIEDVQEGANDFFDNIKAEIYCNASYEKVVCLVTLYDSQGQGFETYDVVFENCVKGQKYETLIELKPSVSLKTKDMGIKLISYK